MGQKSGLGTLVSANIVGASGMANLVISGGSFSGLRSRHNPDIASIFCCDHNESSSGRRPAGCRRDVGSFRSSQVTGDRPLFGIGHFTLILNNPAIDRASLPLKSGFRQLCRINSPIYCTVTATVPVFVMAPEVPVMVMM